MTREISHLFAGRDVVEGDDPRVSGGGEEFSAGGEGYGADGLHEAYSRLAAYPEAVTLINGRAVLGRECSMRPVSLLKM